MLSKFAKMQQLSQSQRNFIVTCLKESLRREDLTLREVSVQVGVDVSQVSRYLNGHFKRMSPNLEAICKFAKVDWTNAIRADPRKSQVLIGALSDVWDGTREHADALAKTISSLRNYKS